MRISRTALSCLLRLKDYGTYPAGAGPAEALSFTGSQHIAPDLLFHPVLHEAEALAGMSRPEVIRSSPPQAMRRRPPITSTGFNPRAPATSRRRGRRPLEASPEAKAARSGRGLSAACGAPILGQPKSASDIAAGAVAKLRTLLEEDGTATTLAAWAFGGVFGVFLTLTLLAYFLATGGQVVRGLLRLFPPDWRPVTVRIFNSLRPILFRYFAGIAAVIVYAGCAAYIGLGLFLRIRHAAFLAALTGLLEVLPVVGPALSAVTAGLVAIQEAKSAWSIVAYVIYASALRLSIDQLVGPLVLGNAARVHPTLVIFCFLAGGALFGIVGVILAVPFALTVKVALATIYGEPIGGGQ